MGDCLVTAESLIVLEIEDGASTPNKISLTLYGTMTITPGGESAVWVKDQANRNANQPAYKSGTENSNISISDALIDDIGDGATINLRDLLNHSGTYSTLESVNAKNSSNTHTMFKARMKWTQDVSGTAVPKDETFTNCIVRGDITKPQGGFLVANINIETDEPYSTFSAGT